MPARRLDSLGSAVLAVVVVAVVGLVAPAARAGCGCDHPPPAFATVMPPFGSPGKLVRVYAVDGALTPGAAYTVDFGSGDKMTAVAEYPDVLEVAVPQDVEPGPAKLKVKGPGYEREYPDSLFTALARPAPLSELGGAQRVSKFPAAVSTGGTLLIPVDLSAVLDPVQFAFELRDLPLAFGQDDVVFYNADGVDLTLFTLTVADPTERQWGSYYGWRVEEDTDLHGDVYESKALKALGLDEASDVLTYWRHEFHTYAAAHAPGGSHEVDADGFHPDGTRHVDHAHLVLAIQGVERKLGGDPAEWEPPSAGKHDVDLLLVGIPSPHPVEPGAVAAAVTAAAVSAEEVGYEDD